MQKKLSERIQNVLLGLIDIPEHIDREEIDSDYIGELADSIRELGLLQPILLRSVDSRFELIAGHRRYLAHKLLGRVDIPATVKNLTDNDAVLARAVENLQRVDLTIMEEAKVYQSMVAKLGLSIDEIAKKLGKGVGTVRRKLSFLKLAAVLQEAMHKGKIGYAVAEELDSLQDIGKIEYYLGWCIDHGATLMVVRNWVQEEKSKMREEARVADRTRGEVVIPRSAPVYVPCDLCSGPMSIGQESVIRCCPACAKQLNEIISKQA